MQRSFTLPQSVYDLAEIKKVQLIKLVYLELDHNANHTKEYYTLNCGYNLQKGETHITRRQLEEKLGVSGRQITNMLKMLIENGDIREIRKGSKRGKEALPSIYYLTRYDETAEEIKNKAKEKKKDQKLKESNNSNNIDIKDLF